MNRISTEDSLRKELQIILDKENKPGAKKGTRIKELQLFIAANFGLPVDTVDEIRNVNNTCSLRARVWKILLNVGRMDAEYYLGLLYRSPTYEKIVLDVNRTKPKKCNTVDIIDLQAKLLRILNAYANIQPDPKNCFIQGMSWSGVIFGLVLPELDSFYSYLKFSKSVSTYHGELGKGGVCGWKLTGIIMQYVDNKLYTNLTKKEKFGFWVFLPVVTSMFANFWPLSEVLKLWDFFIAFGFHMNVLLTVAYVKLYEEDFIEMESTNISDSCQNKPFEIEAKPMIALALKYIYSLPQDLYDALVNHLQIEINIDELAEMLPPPPS